MSKIDCVIGCCSRSPRRRLTDWTHLRTAACGLRWITRFGKPLDENLLNDVRVHVLTEEIAREARARVIAQAFGHTPLRLGDPVTLRRRGLGVYFEIRAPHGRDESVPSTQTALEAASRPVVSTTRTELQTDQSRAARQRCQRADVDLGFAAGSGEQTHAVGNRVVGAQKNVIPTTGSAARRILRKRDPCGAE